MSSDPFCLKCHDELAITPEGWASKSTGSTECSKGGQHSMTLPRRDGS